jgi:excisionase family DNA binding protein
VKEYFRTSEAAKFLNVTSATIVNWINSGKLPAYATAGGHYRISRKDLIKFMEKNDILIPNELQSNKYKVLIVDDERNVVESVIEILKDTGINIEIEVAYDGFEAGTKLLEFLPDLVILDAKMPGANGDVVVKKIRESEKLKHIKTLVFTGYPDIGATLLRLGADKMIEKSTHEANVDNLQKEVIRLLDIKYHKVVKPTKETRA